MNPISTRIHPTIRLGILLPAAFLLQVISLQAATIYQTVEDSDNSSPNWNDELWGTPAAAPISGNDYISDGNEHAVTRLNVGNSAATFTFEGDSLTLRNGVTLYHSAYFVADLILENGSGIYAGTGRDMSGGSITINNGHSSTYTSLNRGMQLGAGVHGGGDFTLIGAGSGIFDVESSNNTFSGNWILDSGITLTGVAEGSLGDASFIVNEGTVAIQYDFAGAGSSLTLNENGLFDLNGGGFSHTFSSVNINGSFLTPGTYGYDDFAPADQSYFIDGTDTITVIPEPSTLLLTGLFMLTLTVSGTRRFR